MQVKSYELGQYVKVVDEIFSEKMLDTFYRVCKEVDFEDSLVGGGKGIVNKEIRNTLVLPLSKYQKNLTLVHWSNYFANKLNNAIVNHYLPIVPHLAINPVQDIQLL